jgi:hypothetical protein
MATYETAFKLKLIKGRVLVKKGQSCCRGTGRRPSRKFAPG